MTDTAGELLEELGLGEPLVVSKVPTLVRQLTAADIASLAHAKPVAKAAPNLIVKLRHAHHTLARLVAEGKDRIECSAITGYGVQYVTDLQKDPAFAELVAHYKEQIGTKYLDVHERLATLGVLAIEELQERLTDPEKVKQINATQLREIAESAFDRSVAPAKGPRGVASGNGTGPTINIHFGKKPSQVSIENSPPALIDVTPSPAKVPDV